MSTIEADPNVGQRPTWRAVLMPREHGGWGLTLEPILLGCIVAWSIGGAALGVAALTAFLVRTPLTLALVDHRRGRWLDRSRLAARVAAAELLVLLAAVAVTIGTTGSGWRWPVPVAIAAPLVAIEVWHDVRSRGRRLVPELCGAVGIASAAASIVLAAGRSATLAGGVWLVLAARSIGAIPFVRVQILRLRRGEGPVRQSDLAQVASLTVAVAALLLDRRLAAGGAGVAVLAAVQSVWVRRPPIAAKRLGLRQMVLGFGLVAVTAAGVLWS